MVVGLIANDFTDDGAIAAAATRATHNVKHDLILDIDLYIYICYFYYYLFVKNLFFVSLYFLFLLRLASY